MLSNRAASLVVSSHLLRLPHLHLAALASSWEAPKTWESRLISTCAEMSRALTAVEIPLSTDVCLVKGAGKQKEGIPLPSVSILTYNKTGSWKCTQAPSAE